MVLGLSRRPKGEANRVSGHPRFPLLPPLETLGGGLPRPFIRLRWFDKLEFAAGSAG
jgi:hypothetical protein